MEDTLKEFFDAINRNDVDQALSLCHDDICVTYPDPGRNWKGKERGRVVMTAIFGQLARSPNLHAKYTIASQTLKTITTNEDWGHPNMKISSVYTFDDDHKLVSIES